MSTVPFYFCSQLFKRSNTGLSGIYGSRSDFYNPPSASRIKGRPIFRQPVHQKIITRAKKTPKICCPSCPVPKLVARPPIFFCRPSSFAQQKFHPIQTKFSPVLKNTKKLSPVLSCSKIGRPSFYTGGGSYYSK